MHNFNIKYVVVDDGLGFFSGDIDNFYSWFNDVREASVDLCGLDLTVCVNPVTSFTQFLDIQFKFNNGKLTTDIFRKPTDANRYLYFNSFHPRHTFRSIVYSQVYSRKVTGRVKSVFFELWVPC